MRTKLTYNDFQFYGKHKDMVFDLVGQFADGLKLFSTNVDVFKISALVGVMFNKKSTKDKGENTKILLSQFENRRDDIDHIYRIVMLLMEDGIPNDNLRVNRAFKMSENPELDDYFIQYLLGGLEYMHAYFFSDKKLSFDSMYNKLNGFIKTISTKIETVDIDIEDFSEFELE